MEKFLKAIEEEFVDYSQPADVEDQEKWAVKDIKTAEWCLKKIALHQQRIDEAAAFVKQQKEELDAYLAKAKSEHNSSIDFFKEKLRPFALQQLQGSKKKTVSLPSGNLSFKKQAPEYIKADEELLAFVKQSTPEFLKITEAVDWDTMKKNCQIVGDQLVTPDGEIVQGITVNERDDSFTVKIKVKDNE